MTVLRTTLKKMLRVDQRRDEILDKIQKSVSNRILQQVRTEYTVMPRFMFHQPLDYDAASSPAVFQPPVYSRHSELPVPAPDDRMGYAPNDAEDYLAWGALDHDVIAGHIRRHAAAVDRATLLDFGCSSGRVLRHFDAERRELGWKLCGVDIQARPIEWMRLHFPQYFEVSVCTTMPHLPYPDASVDFIYGISVFTHIKYLWDMWLLELRRILKPGGLLLQSIHAEPAWEFYHENRHEPWVRAAHSTEMLERPQMDVDYYYYGDVGCSQVFWKEQTARAFWGRYFDVLDVAPPPARSFQNWMICRKAA